MKKLAIIICSFFLLLFTKNVYASNFVYVSGASIGIKLNTDVEVLGTYGVSTDNEVLTPWKNLIYEHDIIKKINDEVINSADFLERKIQSSKGKEIVLDILRQNENKKVKIKAAKTKNNYSLGLYIKDCDIGVGTLTFCKEDGKYASLGHKMVDKEIKGGSLYFSSVTGIVKPRGNTPGEKKAVLNKTVIGNVSQNTNIGVYGTLSNLDVLKNMEKMEVATKDDIHKGTAYILTCISSNTVERFDVEIKDYVIQRKGEEKGIKLRITDSRLESITGGIIQGMSGSPIIQDGKLIGALSHVSLKNPLDGFGCYADFMLDNI